MRRFQIVILHFRIPNFRSKRIVLLFFAVLSTSVSWMPFFKTHTHESHFNESSSASNKGKLNQRKQKQIWIRQQMQTELCKFTRVSCLHSILHWPSFASAALSRRFSELYHDYFGAFWPNRLRRKVALNELFRRHSLKLFQLSVSRFFVTVFCVRWSRFQVYRVFNKMLILVSRQMIWLTSPTLKIGVAVVKSRPDGVKKWSYLQNLITF